MTGSSSFVEISSGTLSPLDGKSSIAFWVCSKKDTSGDVPVIDSQWGDDTGGGWQIIQAANRDLVVYVGDDQGRDSLNIPNVWRPGRWQHLAVTKNTDSSTQKVYVNGSLVGTKDDCLFGTTDPGDGVVLRFGGNRTGGTDLACYLSDVLITNTELSTSEISDIYFNAVQPFGTIHRWLLNEGAGSTAIDSVSDCDGSITSATFSANVPTKRRSRSNKNLIYNGDFEYFPPFTSATTGDLRWIDGSSGGSTTNDRFGWAQNTSGSAETRFDTTEKHSGNASLKVSTTATGSFNEVDTLLPGASVSKLVSHGIRVLPSTSYTLSYWMKTNAVSGDSSSGASVVAREYNPAASNVANNGGETVKVTRDWTNYTVTFTTNSATRYVAIEARLYGHQGAATLIMDAWFDDIELRFTSLSRSSV